MKSLFVLPILLLFSVTAARAQEQSLLFKQGNIAYAPHTFYISDVVDDRTDKKTDAVISNRGQSKKVMFAGGLAASLKTFIAKNVAQDKTTQAIILHIKKLEATVKKEDGGWDVEATGVFGFYAGTTLLIEYEGGGQGNTDGEPGDFVEQFIRNGLASDFKKFDSWWPTNKDKVVVSSAVKVNVTISKTTDKPHLIAYSIQRPLQIPDFMGPTNEGTNDAAETVSGVGATYGGEIANGQLNVNVTLLPYFDQSKSWCKEVGKNPYILAHEQAHFDITAIKACELANAIRHTTFTQENYIDVIEQLQAKYVQQAKDEEAQYDSETNHSRIKDQQIMWQNKIAQQVKSVGCY